MLAPIGFGVVFLGLWQLLVIGLQIEPYVVPSPLAIAAEFGANLGSVLSGAARTGSNALIGLVVGAVLGVLGARAGQRDPSRRRAGRAARRRAGR